MIFNDNKVRVVESEDFEGQGFVTKEILNFKMNNPFAWMQKKINNAYDFLVEKLRVKNRFEDIKTTSHLMLSTYFLSGHFINLTSRIFGQAINSRFNFLLPLTIFGALNSVTEEDFKNKKLTFIGQIVLNTAFIMAFSALTAFTGSAISTPILRGLANFAGGLVMSFAYSVNNKLMKKADNVIHNKLNNYINGGRHRGSVSDIARKTVGLIASL